MRHADSSSLARKFHSQYYTKAAVGRLLVDSLRQNDVATALELGAGEGALIAAARGRWPSAHFVSVDIDPRNAPAGIATSRSHFVDDALRHDLPARIGMAEGSADLALCNPPFALRNWDKRYQRILSRAGLPTAGAATFGADAFFIAQNLWLLKQNGELGVIVPAGLIVGSRSQAIREALLEQHQVHQVVELPAGVFSNTEVRTYLLCLQKGSRTNAPVTLRRLDVDGTEGVPIAIKAAEAASRMDYSHYVAEHRSSIKQAKLGDFQVLRGTVEVGSARRLGASLIHTTDIQGGNITWADNGMGELPVSVVRARQGDLLIARVGRKFFAKIAVWEGDEAPLSDCVFAIRSTTYEPSQLFDAFTSEAGQRWLQAHARGACAQYITKDDLQMFPVTEFIK